MNIVTSIMAEKKPESITRDSRGILIRPGLRVAYNHSGDVVFGSVVSLKRSEWKRTREGWWSLKFELLVRNEETQRISTIKNPNSFLIV